ncbi:MAG: beta-ketoacyl-ACP synthase, partial [Microcystis sp.]
QLNLIRSAVNFSLHNCLCLSFGFGGQNAAIAVGRWGRRRGEWEL